MLIDEGPQEHRSERLFSTHGIGVMQAIELARIAHPDRIAKRIHVLGVTIQSASRTGKGLSAAVQNAVPVAAARALDLALC